MTEGRNNSGERLEGLLRRWGADEAARSAQTPPVPRPPMRGRAVAAWGLVLRWGSLAAAGVLLVAAAGFYVAALRTHGGGAGLVGAPATTMPDERGEVARLRAESADLRSRLDQADKRLGALADLAMEVRELQVLLDGESVRHRAEVRQFTAALADRERQRGELAGKLQAAEGRLAALERENRALRPAAAELAKANRRLDTLEKALTIAAKEVQGVRKFHKAATTQLAETRREARRIETRHAQVVAAFQRTYLAAIAPGQRDFQARQAAVRVRRMVERLADLSADAKDESTRRLLARLEVVLTRLDLLDPQRPGTREAFSKLLAPGDLTRQIDEVLAGPGQGEAMRNWLFEAKLILTGAGNAG